MEINLPHLTVTDYEQNNFTGTRGGSDGKPQPPRVRNEHSTYLKNELKQTWEDAGNDVVVYHTHRNGVYLEFQGEQGYELITKSLENRRSRDLEKWVRLLNIRTEKMEDSDDSIETTYATVYVPNSKKDMFFNLIKQYSEADTRYDKPKNANLIDSISNIRKALEEWNEEYCSLNYVAMIPGTYINLDIKQRQLEVIGTVHEK